MKSSRFFIFSALFALLPVITTAQPAGEVSNSNLNYGDEEKLSPVVLPSLEEEPAKKESQKETAPLVKQPKADASSKKQQSSTLSSKQQQEIERIERYLNSINTVVADFTQVAPDGSIASGKFYLKRPGKMRWEYVPPTPVLIIVNGSTVVYYDYELEQVTHLPIDSSLASILARKKIDLNDPELVIEELVTSPGAVRIKIHEKDNKEEGSLLLEMSDQPLRIKNIIVTDAQAQTTTVSLNKARFGAPLERALFIWKDPRERKR